ncbi:MAG: TatD family hydrolase [Planctomycetota bacterium]|nr:TatD family hydrolase [Planctomycetota bacterium]
MITDTHSHLFWKSFDADRAAVLSRAREAGVQRMIVVGTDLHTSVAASELCAEDPDLFATAGVHPHDAGNASPEILEEIEALCRRETCVAVGETGLDYFKEYSPREDQLRAFRWHLELARQLAKPVIVHSREAHRDTAELLAEAPGVTGVMHCYTMGPAQLAPYLEMDLYISFSGVVTYPRNDTNREAARAVPADRLLVETDCPFLAPHRRRGERNEPALVADVLECVATVRGERPDELARATSRNAARLFGLPPVP